MLLFGASPVRLLVRQTLAQHMEVGAHQAVEEATLCVGHLL